MIEGERDPGHDVPTTAYAPGQLLLHLSAAESERAAAMFEASQDAVYLSDLLGHQVGSAEPLLHLVRRPGQSRAAAFREHVENIRRRYPTRSARAPAGAEIPDLSRLYRVSLTETTVDVEALCEQLAQHPGIESASPNTYLRLFTIPLPDVSYVPNDFHVAEGDQWREGSWAEDRPDLWGHQIIEVLEAYDLFADPRNDPGAGVVVAVVDTGVDFNHPDLAGTIWTNPGEDLNGNGVVDESDFDGLDTDHNGFIDDLRGWDFTNYVYLPEPDNEPNDVDGHGTHVSGTIAAVGDNELGTLGVAPNARIMPIGVGFPGGLVGVNETLLGVLYAAENGADVVNTSWGGPAFGAAALLPYIFRYAHSLGVVCVAAAGNGASDISIIVPARYDTTIAVAAIDFTDTVTFFSNWGELIDVAAPGLEVLSVRGEGTDLYTIIPSATYQPGQRFVPPYDEAAIAYRSDGTSMSSPHVAGLAALVLSARPSLGNEEVRQIIRRSSDDLGEPGFDIYYGHGRVNARRAIELTLIWPDCNENWITDADDIAAGTSADVDGNGIPDECQDCNGNGVFDLDDIAAGTSDDCNVNGVPDDCDLTQRISSDCDFNGIPDDCDLAAGTALDCNDNAIPDFCEAGLYLQDCNGNIIPDDCDLAAGTSVDENGNGLPDECEPDCNENGVPDFVDLESGSLDCNVNGIPDECDTDCNGNSIPDDCDLNAGTSNDCDSNDVPDECDEDCNENGIADGCDILAGTSSDCTANGTPDECEDDCNGNGVADSCDLQADVSDDCNFNRRPDECDLADGLDVDCDADGVPDSCQPDCNDNDIADACDVASGTSVDCTGNGVPDECERDCNENDQADSCDIQAGISTDCNVNLIPDECESLFDLDALSEASGRSLLGHARYDGAGASVALAGDVNDDGYDDILIGAWRAEFDESPTGAAYIVFGSPSLPDGESIALAELDGSTGFVLPGVDAYDNMGISVAGVGDLNDDGIDDFVVGAPRSILGDDGRTGGAYVVFGSKELGASGSMDPESLDGSNGFVFTGLVDNDFVGRSVSGAGDLNDDGIADLVIGGHWVDSNGPFSGAAYVVFGAAAVGADGVVSPADLDGTTGFVIQGASSNDQLGFSVAAAGDVNADGIDDLIIGADQADHNGVSSGAIYVLFGAADVGSAGLIEVESLMDGVTGFTFAGESGDWSGYSAASAGDLNDDGVNDLVVGNNPFAGQAAGYVIWGGSQLETSGLLLAEELDGSNGLALVAPTPYTLAVSSAGDFDQDGVDDLILGSPDADIDEARAGAAFVIYGDSELPDHPSIDLVDMSAGLGVVLNGDGVSDGTGSSVSAAGDWNADGLGDIIVGASRHTGAFFSIGAAYVVFGTEDCNHNQLPDECEVEQQTVGDINNNGIPDICEGICDGDVNTDGLVDPLDLGAVLSRFGHEVTPENEIYDVNADGLIDPLDTGFILARFGPCPEL